MRIRSHLLLLAAVVLVPGFVAAAVAIAKVREGERQAALRGLQETVRATALLVDGEVQRSLGALAGLGSSVHLQTGDFAAFHAQAASVEQRASVWTLLLDETGLQRVNTSVPPGTAPPPPSARERVTAVLADQRPVVSDVFVGPASGKLVTTIYMPAKPSPQGRFVVAQAFSVDHWKQTALQPRERSDWIVAVLDRSGKFVARSHRTDELLGRPARPELVAAAAAAHDGMIRHATLEGIEVYDAFTHSELTGWTIAVAAPVATIEASATQAVAWLSAGLAAALALALLAASTLNAALLRAIALASSAASALGQGRRPMRLRTSLNEVNALGDALEEAGRLLEAEQAARAVVEAQRSALLDNERAARADAQRENAAKDEFLALLGHELRNPLAAISGATEVLVRGRSNDATAQRFISIIQRQNRHMKQIVDDLLEVSRLLTGKIALDARPIDLADCVRRCVEALRLTEACAAHVLSLQAQANVWVGGDPVRIEQIVNNLVANALKFSPRSHEVRVRVSAEERQAVIEVSDSGAGIATDLMPHIFEPFVQGPNLRGQHASGLGIGLALVKKLVELHGGSIRAESAGLGAGAVFRVTLPLVVAGDEPSKPAPLASTGHRCRVLLVEDNADASDATAQMLRLLGHEVQTAADGDAGLRALATFAPDVVVLDLGLPGKDGFQVAAEIRCAPGLRHLPLIALTGYGQERDLRASSEAGFDAHLVKPVSPQALDTTIQRQFERSLAEAGRAAAA